MYLRHELETLCNFATESVPHFVWLPLATSSPLLLVNLMEVKASVLPTIDCQEESLSHAESGTTFIARNLLRYVSYQSSKYVKTKMRTAIILSPILPPELKYVTARSQP